jgi:hypothetical protein
MAEGPAAQAAMEHLVLRRVARSITTGKRGVGVSATSFGEDRADEVGQWEAQLLKRLPSDAHDLPDTSLCYLSLGRGEVAVLHRIKVLDGRSGVVAHALVGNQGNLPVLDALALHASGWHMSLDQLKALDGWGCPPCPRDEVTKRATAALPTLEERSRRPDLGDPLTRIVTALVHSQKQQLTVLDADSATAIELLYGLLKMISVLPPGEQPSNRFTFSTFEDDDKVDDLLVFLPTARPTNSSSSRIDVYLRGGGSREKDPKVAALVDLYLSADWDRFTQEVRKWSGQQRFEGELFWQSVLRRSQPQLATGQQGWTAPGEAGARQLSAAGQEHDSLQGSGEQADVAQEALGEAERRLAEAEQELAGIRQQLAEAEQELDSARQRLSEAEQSAAEQRNRAQRAETDVAGVRDELAAAQAELADRVAQQAAMEVAALKARADAVAEAGLLREEVADLRQEMSNLPHRLAERGLPGQPVQLGVPGSPTNLHEALLQELDKTISRFLPSDPRAVGGQLPATAPYQLSGAGLHNGPGSSPPAKWPQSPGQHRSDENSGDGVWAPMVIIYCVGVVLVLMVAAAVATAWIDGLR